jgi:16S rRNA (uracil1498-N3)-methyltransferase
MGLVRLYVDQELGAGQTVSLAREQAHYLFGVMRLAAGDRLELFDGRTGAWAAEVAEAGKRGGALRCVERTAPLRRPPDLWLMFAPIRKARTDFIVEKATEMGAARILPVQTEFTNAERVNRERLQAHAVEAAEQCGGTYVPEVADLARLSDVLAGWPAERQLMFCDEARAGGSSVLADGLAAATPGPREAARKGGRAARKGGRAAPSPWAILIGPEGGFSETERARLAALPQAHPVSLGPRILRADTAAVAALALWQAHLGDWRE